MSVQRGLQSFREGREEGSLGREGRKGILGREGRREVLGREGRRGVLGRERRREVLGRERRRGRCVASPVAQLCQLMSSSIPRSAVCLGRIYGAKLGKM